MEKYRIPLFSLNYGEEEQAAVMEPLKNNWISMGPKNVELEKAFQEMLHVRYACAVTNCTAALHLACHVLGLGPGDEVLCPSLTFAATVNCIRYTGAVPVFCDVRGLDDFGLDADKAEGLITEKTKAVIPMHFAGFPCDMDKINRLADKYGLAVIEDACHGPLSEYKGKKLGTIGDVGCFSFFSNKNISTGEGGMIVTNDEALYEKIKLARSHGMTTMSFERAGGHASSYEIASLGFNYRMDDIRASLGCVQLRKLPSDLEKRKKIRERYEEGLRDLQQVIIPYRGYSGYCSNYIFPIVLKDSDSGMRDMARRMLQEYGIQTSVHYPAVHRFALYRDCVADVANTEYITDNEITLPMYGQLQEQEADDVCECLKKVLGEIY